MAINPVIERRERERRLYIWAAVLMPMIVLTGFARTYYLKGVFGTPPIPSLLVHLHGIVMTSWVLLFAAQVWLVATRRTNVHKRLGVLGAILAALIVLVGVLTAISAAARGNSPGPPALAFLAVPLFDMLLFAILVGAALYFRRRRMDVHKRLMLVSAVNLLTPAIARIPLQFIATGGPLVFFGLTDLILLACIVFDTIRNRRLHPAFLWSTVLLVLSQPLRLMLSGTDVWMRFASWLVN